MTSVVCSNELRLSRTGSYVICARGDLDSALILERLRSPGEILKQSKKALIRRVGEWVIKDSAGSAGVRALRHTLQRARYRQPWLAAHHLRANGVNVPEPLAYIEKGRCGVVTRGISVSQYLEGFRDVEHFLVALVQRGAGKETIADFLAGIADAVNALNATGAFHADLSGKNIFTRDGAQFYFIDMDAVVLGQPYDGERRMKNHVQLYDSFCDHLNDVMLVPFITRMLLPEHDARVWMPRLRKAQAERRRKINEKWEKQGVPPRIAGVD